ncbi:MAG: 30S ribosomal protein S12 methylthiotransferase RimO [Defluviitaleaceae bacterium]|nr:30S ribosomal protein S12 methylthiotransferase RimO [Defluviitaleaceae bacterium]MCL2837160.1 30S ribosomal protein S12 methylthiotransferase RimO [Defluviitaleaceae bacterium]
MNKPKIALISLGCDKNLVESERMLGSLGGGSYAFSPGEDDADIIIINTCGFIRDAADEAKEHIIRALELKASGPCRWVIVTGCLAQRHKDALLEEFPEIDGLVTDTSFIKKTVEELTGIEAERGASRILSTPAHYAYLKIAEGCDNACAYCAIPLIKGPFASRPMDELLEEAKSLADGGVKELIIIAQDTALYGKDLYGEPRIAPLLRELAKIDGIEWLRLMYCYPEHITGELIDEIAKNPKICHYLDMPVQHSNGDVLQRMGRLPARAGTEGSEQGRGMDENGLRDLIGRLRAAIPDIVLRTTVMAGFPGETKQEFQSMLKFLEDTRFDRLGAFAYSREEGTPAYDLPGQLTDKTKTARRDRVMEQQISISQGNLQKNAGKTLRMLVDGWDGIAGVYYGRSYMDCPEVDGLIYVRTKFGSMEPGTFADVTINETDEYDMFGVL